MKTQSPSLAAWAIVTVSCAAWIAGISLALVYSLGLSNQAGWVIAAVLGVPVSLAVGVIVYEMGHAIDLADYIDPSEFNGLKPTLPMAPAAISRRSLSVLHAF